MKTHVGTKACPRCRFPLEIRSNIKIIGADAGNIIAAIMATHMVRNSGARMPIVRPAGMVALIIVDCRMTSSQPPIAREISEARSRVRSRGSGNDPVIPSRPGPSERGIIGTFAGVIPAKVMVSIAASYARRLDQLGEKRMRVAFYDLLIRA